MDFEDAPPMFSSGGDLTVGGDEDAPPSFSSRHLLSNRTKNSKKSKYNPRESNASASQQSLKALQSIKSFRSATSKASKIDRKDSEAQRNLVTSMNRGLAIELVERSVVTMMEAIAKRCNHLIQVSKQKFKTKIKDEMLSDWISVYMTSGESCGIVLDNMCAAGNLTAVVRLFLNIMPQDQSDLLQQEVSSRLENRKRKKKFTFARFLQQIPEYNTTEIDLGILLELVCRNAFLKRLVTCMGTEDQNRKIDPEEALPLLQICFQQLVRTTTSLNPKMSSAMLRKGNELALSLIKTLSNRHPELALKQYTKYLERAVRKRKSGPVELVFQAAKYINIGFTNIQEKIDLIMVHKSVFKSQPKKSKSFRDSRDMDVEIYNIPGPRRAALTGVKHLIEQYNCCNFDARHGGKEWELVEALVELKAMIERISPIDHPNEDLEIARRVQVLLATIGARLPRIKYLDFMSTFKQRLSSKHALSDGMIESTIETVIELMRGPGGKKHDTTFSRVIANGLAEDGYDMREPQVIRFALQTILTNPQAVGMLKSRGVNLASEALLAIGANVIGTGCENVKDTSARTIKAALGGMSKGLTNALDIRNHKNPTLARVGIRTSRLALDSRTGFIRDACGDGSLSQCNRDVVPQKLTSEIVSLCQDAAGIVLVNAVKSLAISRSGERADFRESRCEDKQDEMNTNLLSEPAFPDIIETRRRVADGTKSRDWLECVMEILSCTELLNEYWCLSKIPSAIVLGRWLLHPLLQQASRRALRSLVRRTPECGPVFLAILGCLGKNQSIQMRDTTHAEVLLNMCYELLELWSRVHGGDRGVKLNTVFEAPMPPLFGDSKSVDWITHIEVACLIAFANRASRARLAALDLMIQCGTVRDRFALSSSSSGRSLMGSSSGDVIRHIAARAEARCALERANGSVQLRKKLVVGSSQKDIATHIAALRKVLSNEDSLPYFLAEFACAALEINDNTAKLARDVILEQLVGTGLKVPLSTDMVIQDYGRTEAPHAAPEWCNTHVLYHALCNNDVTEVELANSLNSVLQALEKITSKGRGLEWMIPYVSRIFSATHVERLAAAVETLWKWFAPLMRKKQKLGRPLLPHIWRIARSMSQHPHLRNQANLGRGAEASVGMLCDMIADPFFVRESHWANGKKPSKMEMIARAEWFIQPLRMIHEVADLIVVSHGKLKTWPTATRRGILEWIRSTHDWPLRTKEDSENQGVAIYVDLVFRTSSVLSNHGRLLRQEHENSLKSTFERYRQGDDKTLDDASEANSEFSWWLAIESKGYPCIRNLIAFHPVPVFDLCVMNVYLRERNESLLFYHSLLDQVLPSSSPPLPTQNNADDIRGHFADLGMFGEIRDVSRVYSSAMLLNTMMGIEQKEINLEGLDPVSIQPQVLKPVSILVIALRALVDRARSVRSRAFDAVTRTVVEMLVPSKKKKKNRTLSAQEISGWVSKKGGAGLYQKRWLRLRGNVLSWSLKETSQNTKGAIMVRNSQVVPSKDGKTFSIVPSDRSEKTYTFQVSEKKDMVMWVSVLQMASLVGTQKAITIEEKRKSTGGGVKSKVDMSLEARLTRYYKKYNPDQLEKIPYLAKKYKGNEKVLFEALGKKYGPEPSVEEVERRHEMLHSSNADIARRFLSIMAALSSTFNSDSCGLKQQDRVVSEVAMALAKIGKCNEVLREIFTTCRESQLQETWGGLARSCTIASSFIEFVTFQDQIKQQQQEEKEEDEDDDDDDIPKEKAMDGMLRVLLGLTRRFPLENMEEPLHMWAQLASPENVKAIIEYIVAVCMKRTSRALHEIVNVVFRTQPVITANVLMQILDSATSMKDPEKWRSVSLVVMRILIPLVMIDCNAVLPHMPDILIHCILQMPRDESNTNGTAIVNLHRFSAPVPNILLKNVMLTLHSTLAARAAAAASEDDDNNSLYTRAVATNDGSNEMVYILQSPLFLLNWHCVSRRESKNNDDDDDDDDNQEESRDLNGILRMFVRVLGSDCVVKNFLQTLRKRSLELAFKTESYGGDVSVRFHSIYQALLNIEDEYNHDLAMEEVKQLDDRIEISLRRVADLKLAVEEEKHKNKLEEQREIQEKKKIEHRCQTMGMCLTCDSKLDSHSRVCVKPRCGRTYCVSCKKKHMKKQDYREWKCNVCETEEQKEKNTTGDISSLSQNLKSVMTSLEISLSSMLELCSYCGLLGQSTARSKLLTSKIFWICISLIRVSNVSSDSSRLLDIALRCLSVIASKKDLLKHAIDSRPEDATSAWPSVLQNTLLDGTWSGVVPLIVKNLFDLGCSSESSVGVRARDVALQILQNHKPRQRVELSIVSLVVMLSAHLRNFYLRSRDTPRASKIVGVVSMRQYLDVLRTLGAPSGLLSAVASAVDDSYLERIGEELGKLVKGSSTEIVSLFSELVVYMIGNRGFTGVASQLRLQCCGLSLATGFIGELKFNHLRVFKVILDASVIFALKPIRLPNISAGVSTILAARQVYAKKFSMSFMLLCTKKRIPNEARVFENVTDPLRSIADLMKSQVSNLPHASAAAALSLMSKESVFWKRCSEGYSLIKDRDEAAKQLASIQDQTSKWMSERKDAEQKELEIIAQYEEKQKQERKRRQELIEAAKKADEEAERKLKEEIARLQAEEDARQKAAEKEAETPPIPLKVRSSSIDLKKDGRKEQLVVMDCDFDADNADSEQVSCVKGEYLFLINAYDDGWSQVRKRSNGKVGIVPSDFYNLAENQA